MSITLSPFGTTKEGQAVTLFRLENQSGAYAEIMSYGATVRTVCVPDKDKRLTDVCLGYDTFPEYEGQDACLGSFLGRCANRIAKGRFALNGTAHSLAVNNGPNHLHGGLVGFDKRVWAHSIQGDTLVLTLTSPDGEEGYPGTLQAEARYTFTEDNRLILECRAVTDADTAVNLSNHAYWNLNGHGAGGVGEHTLQVPAAAITENDVSSCPTGAYYPVEGTPFDLREPKPLGLGWDAADPQMEIGRGYDHNYALEGTGLRTACVLSGATSGITLTLSTTQPGLQVYTANWLTDRPGKNGARYARRCGVALEAQGFPNAVNLPGFPSVVLKSGQRYEQTIIFAFS